MFFAKQCLKTTSCEKFFTWVQSRYNAKRMHTLSVVLKNHVCVNHIYMQQMGKHEVVPVRILKEESSNL